MSLADPPFTVRRFQAEDLGALELQEAQAGELRWFEARAAGRAYEEGGPGLTVRDDTGTPIFCGGAIERHLQYASLWGLFGAKLDRAAARFLLARTRRFIAGLPHRRVDALVEDRAAAVKYALRLGLVPEARLKAAALEGQDMIVFVRSAL